MPDFKYENEVEGIVAGVDEAGRGPWAGPVVAAAVILTEDLSDVLINGLNDSKKISDKKRQILFDELHKNKDIKIGVGIIDVDQIDKINILQATFCAMNSALENLALSPDMALIDGNKTPPKAICNTKAIVKGDSKSISIAAASIVAKVTRDEIMKNLALEYPYYGWEKNAGYGTKAHKEGLEKYGVTKYHRKSYAPIKKILGLQR